MHVFSRAIDRRPRRTRTDVERIRTIPVVGIELAKNMHALIYIYKELILHI